MKKSSFSLAILILFSSIMAIPLSQDASAATAQTQTFKKGTTKVKTVTKSKKAQTANDKTSVDAQADAVQDAKIGDGVACRAGVVMLFNDYQAQIAAISSQTADDANSRATLAAQRVDKLNKLYASTRTKNKTSRDASYKSLQKRAKSDGQKKAVQEYITTRDNLSNELITRNNATLETFKTQTSQAVAAANAASQTGLPAVTQANTTAQANALAACTPGKKLSQVKDGYRSTIRGALISYRSTTRTGFVDQMDSIEQARRKGVSDNNDVIAVKMVAARHAIEGKMKAKKTKVAKAKKTTSKKSTSSSSSSSSSTSSSSSSSSTTAPAPTTSTAAVATAPSATAKARQAKADKKAKAAAATAAKREARSKAAKAAVAAKKAKAQQLADKKKLARSTKNAPPTKLSQCNQNLANGGVGCSNKGHSYSCQETKKIKASAGKVSHNEISGCVKQD